MNKIILDSAQQPEEKMQPIPKHLAIIMDGNGRWAKKRNLPRYMGHKRGIDALENAVRACVKFKIKYLTVFAFSTENWKRPKMEVSFLINALSLCLDIKVKQLHQNNVRFRLVGDDTQLYPKILDKIKYSEELTQNNDLLTLTIAFSYGGKWDIVRSINQLIEKGYHHITEEAIASHLVLADLPDPDLLIRTGGEARISNFLLWQMAYTEFYFTEVLWPDFDEDTLRQAIVSYQMRERRFGKTSEQLIEAEKRD